MSKLQRTPRAAPLAVLFSVACHPSMIYETAISAEFPGVAVRHLNADFQTEGTGLNISFQGKDHFYFDQHLQWNLPWKSDRHAGRARLYHSEVLL